MATELTTIASNIINDAFYLVGAKDIGSDVEAPEMAVALRLLNGIMKQLQTAGVQLHTVLDVEIPLYGSKQSYKLGPASTTPDVTMGRPMRIISARIENSSGYETPMTELSREDYKRMVIKSTVGVPTQFAFEKQKDYGLVYVWPISDAASLVLSDYTMIATVQRAIDIMGTADTAPDLPSEMHIALTYALGAMLPYGLATAMKDVKTKAPAFMTQLLVSDQETTSITVSPAIRSYHVQ